MKNAKGYRANVRVFCNSAAFKLGYSDSMAGKPMREEWELTEKFKGRSLWRYERGRMFAAWCRARAERENRNIPAKLNGRNIVEIVKYFREALADGSIV